MMETSYYRHSIVASLSLTSVDLHARTFLLRAAGSRQIQNRDQTPPATFLSFCDALPHEFVLLLLYKGLRLFGEVLVMLMLIGVR